MPRPIPHSFARQLGLQTIMWGLFVAALVGASQVSHRRDRGLRIGEMLPAEQFGWIKIAVPKGWTLAGRTATEVAAKEPKHDGIERVLIISQEQLNGPADAKYLLRQLKHNVTGMPILFAGLHVWGQYADLTLLDEESGAVTQEYYAVAVLPNNVIVRVVLRGVPAFGPIDDENFRQIVNSFKPGASLPPNQVLPRAIGPLDPV